MCIIYGPLLFLSLLFTSTLSNEICDPDDLQCLLKNDPRDVIAVSERPYTNATLPCNAFLRGNVLKAQWWVGRRSKLAGEWTITDKHANYKQYAVNSNSSLTVFNVNRTLVEEYECVVYYKDGSNASSFVLLRLDYSFYYSGPIFSTVFWGSCLTSLICCVASFILNILWIIVRKISMWWINRSERINRVRSMLEAMEKYKNRQMDTLHENYQRRVNAIRENYHQQVEEIRTSYTRQADRFRDYRQAQMEKIDNLKENYNQQLNRIRDYGSRRADRLLESYERQLNRMRTFTLQHRLRLMRQYKLKQHQINQLLENISESQPQTHEKKAIHPILDLENPVFPRSEYSRSTSFYSLPDLTSDEFSDNTNHNFPLVDFKQFRHSIYEKGAKSKVLDNEIASVNDIDIEQQPSSSSAPLIKHHRRKSSNLRTVSSFNNCREQP